MNMNSPPTAVVKGKADAVSQGIRERSAAETFRQTAGRLLSGRWTTPLTGGHCHDRGLALFLDGYCILSHTPDTERSTEAS
jgi:hypothetical protein